MAVRTILQGDVPELRRPSEAVTAYDLELHQLLDDMRDTMRHYGGIGLAAPQIGQPIRAFIVDIGDGLLEFINPVIEKYSGEQPSVESCLSFPGITLQVTRPEQVSLAGHDRMGNVVRCDASALLARVISHEVDHLDGVLFMDHLCDEEIFEQMMMQIGMGLQDELEEAIAEDTGSIEATILDSRWDEIHQAIRLLADAAWKTTLAYELLLDHEDLLETKVRFEDLKQAEDGLNEVVERWEKAIQEASPQAHS